MGQQTGTAPGRSHREGTSLLELASIFPEQSVARRWFEAMVWPHGRECPRCGSDDTYEGTHRSMPYR